MTDAADPLVDLVAPVDPRSTARAVPLGSLPREARFGELLTRVLAPNPSRMSLDGTNTYLVTAPGSGVAGIVDPGPPDPDHLARVAAALEQVGARCRWILVTHHHGDHAEAALPWAEHFDAQVGAARRSVCGPAGRELTGGDTVRFGGTVLDVVATPGHCGDHLAFRLESGELLVGDHILGRGTSVVTQPEGDLLAYLDSLRRVLDLGPHALHPGHGPEMTEDPAAVVEYYLAHRRFREQQVVALLAGRPHSVESLVARIYADVDRALWPMAAQSTGAALEKLRAEGRIADAGGDLIALVPGP